MQAFNNDPKLKTALLKEIKKHQKADMIVQRIYEEGEGEKFRGCSVGCAIHSMELINKTTYEKDNRHELLEGLTGIPQVLWRLNDSIFERLDGYHLYWPYDFIKAIPVGKDLRQVIDKFLLWLMTDPDGPSKLAPEYCKPVAELYERKLNGDEPTFEDWEKNTQFYAMHAADFAAKYAAEYAQYADYSLKYVSDYAKYAAEYAENAGYPAGYLAKYTKIQANKLMELMASSNLEDNQK